MEAIRARRDQTGCPLQEAKASLLKDALIAMVQDAQSIEDLKPVLIALIERIK